MKRKQILSNDQITARFSQASVQDLKVAFEELQALDRRHRAWSRSRRWAERLSPCISQMTKPGGFLDIVQPLASANEVAALTVGGLKAILVLVYSISSSYTLLAERTEELVSLFQSAAVYARIERVTPDIEECLTTVLHGLSRFFQLAYGRYEKRSGRLRALGNNAFDFPGYPSNYGLADNLVFDFIFTSYGKAFAEINQNIDAALKTLYQVAIAEIFKMNTEAADARKKQQSKFTHVMRILLILKVLTGQRCIDSLHATNVDDIWDRYDQKRIRGTCDWLFRDKTAIKTWYDDPISQFLLITGQTGCGKTTVASCIVKRLQHDMTTANAGKKPSTLVCSYTTEQDGSTRNDAASTTRAFLLQAFVQREHLTGFALTTSDRYGGCHNLSFSQLWNIMLSVVDNIKPDRVYIVVDGIDKYDLDPLNDLIPALNSLHQRPNVKILVTCRDINIHKFKLPDSTVRFDISKATGKDLGLIVSAAFAGLPDFQVTRREEQHLTMKIVAMAGSCTLWATMVLDALTRSNKRLFTDMWDLIDQTPPDLEACYLRCLISINPQERAEAARLLHILLGARVQLAITLSVEGLRHALASHRIYENPQELESSCQSASYFPVYLKKLLGILIHIDEDRVTLAHSSVAEYLRKLAGDSRKSAGGNAPLAPSDITSTFGCSLARCSFLVAEACVNYLRTCDICGLLDNNANIPGNNWEWEFGLMCVDCDEPEMTPATPASSLTHPAPFFNWAAAYWHAFVRYVGDNPLQQHHFKMPEDMLEAIIALSDRRLGASCRWAQHCSERDVVRSPDRATIHLADISPLVVAAHYSQKPVLEFILRRYSADFGVADYKSALVWASRQRDGECLSVLLKHLETKGALSQDCAEADLNVCLHAALFAAAEKGAGHNVIIILEAYPAIDVTQVHARNHSPLSISIAQNTIDIAKTLLDAASLDKADLGDIILAVEFSPMAPGVQPLDIEDLYYRWHLDQEVKVLRALLEDNRIDISARNKRGRSLLSYAAESGRCDVLDLLLTSSQTYRSAQVQSLINDMGDREGKTPMWYASWNNHVSFLTKLCEAGDMTAQVATRSVQDGETAFSAAARRGHSDVICFLASKWPAELHTRDKWDRTLLSATALAEDHQGAATASLLLSLGAASTIEAESDTGTTALEYAVKSSRLELMGVLILEGGANADRILTIDPQGDVHLITQPAAEWTTDSVRQSMVDLTRLQREKDPPKLVRRNTLRAVAEAIRKRNALARAFASHRL